MEEMKKVTEGVVDVIVYPSAADKTKNRGFSFVEYKDHKAAAMARRKLMPGKFTTASEVYNRHCIPSRSTVFLVPCPKNSVDPLRKYF